jgi:DNA-binding LytR/AlgR family response regulator
MLCLAGQQTSARYSAAKQIESAQTESRALLFERRLTPAIPAHRLCLVNLPFFCLHGLDYLLKPIGDRRFRDALQRAQARAASKTPLIERLVKLIDESSPKGVTRFTVRSGSRLQVVLAQDIQWVGAAGDYVELHTRNGSYLLRETMNALERKLDFAEFIRIHRSRIVQSACIRELRAIENRESIVKLLDQSEHRSSRTYAGRSSIGGHPIGDEPMPGLHDPAESHLIHTHKL